MPGLKVGFIPIEGGHYYGDALAEVVRGEELGFDSVWMEEHHSVVDHYWPSPLPVLAGFATGRRRCCSAPTSWSLRSIIRRGWPRTCALLDVMSGGRAVLGVAIGYKPDEFALYGADLAKRGARFEEQLAIVKGLWTQDRCPSRGRTTRSKARSSRSRSRSPHPPIWIGGWGDITLRRAATLADNWIPGPTGRSGAPAHGQEAVSRQPRGGRAHHAVTEWPLTRDVIIADTDKEARELAERHIMVSYRKEYAGGLEASVHRRLHRHRPRQASRRTAS